MSLPAKITTMKSAPRGEKGVLLKSRKGLEKYSRLEGIATDSLKAPRLVGKPCDCHTKTNCIYLPLSQKLKKKRIA